MKADSFVLSDYYNRIGYNGGASTTLELVRDVMRCHLYTVPFENIDVQLGMGVSLECEDIVDKIIYRGRGGYCYEQNTLFALFLERVGVTYQFLGCRPMFYPAVRPRTHVALLADIDGERWLCDLGFGALGVCEPLNISCVDTVIYQGSEQFQLCLEEPDMYVLKALNEGEWQRQYGFNLSRFEMIDFVPANYFNATHADSLFVQKLLLLIKTKTGRFVLLDKRLKKVEGEKVEERILGRDEFECSLTSAFNVPDKAAKEITHHIYNAVAEEAGA